MPDSLQPSVSTYSIIAALLEFRDKQAFGSREAIWLGRAVDRLKLQNEAVARLKNENAGQKLTPPQFADLLRKYVDPVLRMGVGEKQTEAILGRCRRSFWKSLHADGVENAGVTDSPTKDAEPGELEMELAARIMQTPPGGMFVEDTLANALRDYYKDTKTDTVARVKMLRKWRVHIARMLPAMQEMVSFDVLFKEHRLTDEERRDLAHHLASMRYKRTLEALIPGMEVSWGELKEDDEPSA